MKRALASALLAALTFSLSSNARAGTGLACYYGVGRLDELSRFDTVILQPAHYTKADVATLKAAGVSRVLGYVSLGEDDALRRGNGRGPGGQASWYLDEYTGAGFKTIGPDHVADSNAEWGSYYVNPGDRTWRQRVRAQARAIHEMGMDGVFADTVLVPVDVFTAKTETRVMAGMDRLVRSLKGWTHGGTVYVNNGTEGIPRWRGKVDGVVIEDAVTGTPEFWLEIRRRSDMAVQSGGKNLRVTGLFYVRSDAEKEEACNAARMIELPVSLYLNDPDGLALKKLPDAVCPAPALP